MSEQAFDSELDSDERAGLVCRFCGELDCLECEADPWIVNASPSQLRDYFSGAS